MTDSLLNFFVSDAGPDECECDQDECESQPTRTYKDSGQD